MNYNSGKGVYAIVKRSLSQIVSRPINWVGFLLVPIFMFIFLGSMLDKGLPTRIPAAIVDRDGSNLSRSITQNLDGMQMVELSESLQSYTEARHAMQEGKIYGFFLIPENFQSDLLSGRQPAITFYTNSSFFIPSSLLFKTFKTTAVYTKAGVMMKVAEAAGQDSGQLTSLIRPVNIQCRPIGNPALNYGIYIGNSFMPCTLQLMILLMTCFSIGQEIKYRTSTKLLEMANGSILKAIFAKLLPQTAIWMVVATFMTAWLFKYNGYPMNGSWGWIFLSEFMYVLACQGFALFIISVIPNLRLALSVSALLGILSFSLGAFSFPVQSMYGGMAIFSYIIPVRYNFLIYIDQALNGIDIFYSRLWFVAYIIFMLLPFTMLWNLKRVMKRPVYIP